ncbi:MAG: hypothetical protein R3274_01175 [Desulfobacterales bacterium]|nr:hypothetical protein [Desulfobacterales bacterium]
MKIDGNNDIARSALTDNKAAKEKTSDAEFKHILKASVERTQQSAAKVHTAPHTHSMAALRFTPPTRMDREITVERLDNLLNLLDQYKDQLADPNVTLRRIEPLLNTITTEKEQLSGLMDGLPDDDSLKDIVHRTLITASLEVLKFNRGDYISG